MNTVDKAKLLVLNVLKNNFGRVEFQPTFDDIIKLRILAIDDKDSIRQLAQTVLNNYPHELNSSKIQNFDLETFILIHSRENAEKFTEFSKEILTKTPDYAKIFFKKVVSSSSSIYDNESISEECLLFYPYFITENIEFITGELLGIIIDLIVEKYTNDSKEMVQ